MKGTYTGTYGTSTELAARFFVASFRRSALQFVDQQFLDSRRHLSPELRRMYGTAPTDEDGLPTRLIEADAL
jgi:hypothetical protein